MMPHVVTFAVPAEPEQEVDISAASIASAPGSSQSEANPLPGRAEL